MQVINQFLSHTTFTELKRQVLDKNFPWYFPNTPGEPEQYVNLAYYDHQFLPSVTPKLMRCLQKCTDQLNAIAILRVKFNATPRNAPFQIWHRDWKLSTPSKTCVIYLNTCDGYTEFRSGRKVYSKENTAVIFDTGHEHRGIPATDVERRLVLNINYFEK